jgi:hypothetical protein
LAGEKRKPLQVGTLSLEHILFAGFIQRNSSPSHRRGHEESQAVKRVLIIGTDISNECDSGNHALCKLDDCKCPNCWCSDNLDVEKYRWTQANKAADQKEGRRDF